MIVKGQRNYWESFTSWRFFLECLSRNLLQNKLFGNKCNISLFATLSLWSTLTQSLLHNNYLDEEIDTYTIALCYFILEFFLGTVYPENMFNFKAEVSLDMFILE